MRVRTLAAMMAAAVVVAGCGSSSNSSGNSSSGGSSTKASKPAATTTKAATTAVTNASTSKTSATSFASDANCLNLTGVSAKFAQAMASATGAKFNETAVAADFQKLADAAPSAIRPDLETIAAAFSKFAIAFKKSGYVVGKTPTAAQTAALESSVSVLEAPQLEKAEKALQSWSVKNCS